MERAAATSADIRKLNDEFRISPSLPGILIAQGRWVITRGAADYGNQFIDAAVEAVREFDAFTPDNDPWNEHDFGSFESPSGSRPRPAMSSMIITARTPHRYPGFVWRDNLGESGGGDQNGMRRPIARS